MFNTNISHFPYAFQLVNPARVSYQFSYECSIVFRIKLRGVLIIRACHDDTLALLEMYKCIILVLIKAAIRLGLFWNACFEIIVFEFLLTVDIAPKCFMLTDTDEMITDTNLFSYIDDRYFFIYSNSKMDKAQI